MTRESSKGQLDWSDRLRAWRRVRPGVMAATAAGGPAWNDCADFGHEAGAVERSGVFQRVLATPSAAVRVLRIGVLGLLLGRIGWIAMSLLAGDSAGNALWMKWASGSGLSASVVLLAFHALCIGCLLLAGRSAAPSRAWAHDLTMLLAAVVLLITGAVTRGPLTFGRVAEDLSAAALPLIWLLVLRFPFARATAVALARGALVLAFAGYASLFYSWPRELDLLGQLLARDIGLGLAATRVLMLGCSIGYAIVAGLLAASAWSRRLERHVFSAAVTLGAFTAGIRICLGLEPGFFQASAGHWLLSTLLGASVACLPLFMALCADSGRGARAQGTADELLALLSPRRRGPRSAA